ncbi:MAG TPA: cytochrome P450 [Pirellulales bacterium]|nr:cytochrome P450 [Pirellulales bacterium]
MIKTKWPPGPSGLPIVGSLFEFRHDPTGFSLRMARDYGDAVHFLVGRQHVVQLNDPELIRDVLVTRHRAFSKGRGLDSAEIIFGNGLVRSEGDTHLRQRRLMQPAFQRERVAAYAPAVMEEAVAACRRWQEGESVDMFAQMMRITASIAVKALFSSDLEANFEQLGRDLKIAAEYLDQLTVPLARLLSRLPTPGRCRFMAARHRLDTIIYAMLRERRASGKSRSDLLGMLMAAQDDEGDGRGMSDLEVRDEAMVIFLAGHETTATALTWTWYLLAEHPSIEKELHEELDTVLDGRFPRLADLERLRYTRMVIAESMRLYPPVWLISRRALSDYAFSKWHVPAGTTIGMSQYVMHRDPRYYPDPETFDPLRWTDEELAKRPKYSYFPFGGGPRVCIGESFAWMEATLILATLCQIWRARTSPGHNVQLQPLIALRPRGGMPMQLERRRADAQPLSAFEPKLVVNA